MPTKKPKNAARPPADDPSRAAARLPETEVVFADVLAERSDVAIVAIPEGAARSPEIASLDAATLGAVGTMISAGDFRGEAYELTMVYLGPDAPARRLLLAGLGKADALTPERARRIAGAAARRARSFSPGVVACGVAGWDALARLGPDFATTFAHALLEGLLLGAYAFPGLRKEPPAPGKGWTKIRLALPRRGRRAAAQAAAARAQAAAGGVYLARDLAYLPGNRLTPRHLAEAARRLEQPPAIRVSVFDEKEIASLGMHALLAVSAGSVEPPRFVVLEYASGRRNAKRLALVGKGLTFDSGGLSLKPAARMEQMKYDMCGAAAVLGVFSAVAKTGAPVDLVGAIACSENLPSGSAVRPGDVIGSYSGKTIEVLNTDAEGRLVLADALAYVEAVHKPDAMIDLATLTGAIGTALGNHASGLFTESDALAALLEEAGETTGERTWRLPLWEDYLEHVRSDIADVKNIANSNVGAGATIGAAFLRRFVEKTPWAHLDIASVSWAEKEAHYVPRGPTGYGVRLLLRLIEAWGSPRKGARGAR